LRSSMRARGALAYNGLALDGDERLVASALDGSVSGVQLAEAVYSARRIRLAEEPRRSERAMSCGQRTAPLHP